MSPTSRRTVERVRGLAFKGESPGSIASALGLAPGDVARILDRPIHGRLADAVRAKHAAGDPAEAIALGLSLPLGRVADFLARITPRRGLTRKRPRSRAAQARPPGRPASAPRPRSMVRSEWSGLRGPEWRDEELPPAIAAAEAPELLREDLVDGQGVDQLGEPATSPGDGSGKSKVTSTDPEWGSVHDCGRSGAASGNAALNDAGALRARELRAAGVPRKDVAAMLGVSVATITRLTRGETYRSPSAEPIPIAPPATSPATAEAPRRSTWCPPSDAGPEWRDD